MPNTQDLIIDYLKSISHDVITISPEHASHIITLVESATIDGYAKIVRQVHNDKDDSWQTINTEQTTDELIALKMRESLFTKPVEKCYRIQCYFSNGVYAGEILTINPELFN